MLNLLDEIISIGTAFICGYDTELMCYINNNMIIINEYLKMFVFMAGFSIFALMAVAGWVKTR